MKTLFAAALGLTLFSSLAHADPKVVAYVPNWINLEEFSKTIDYAKVTHLNIAFENPTDDTGELSFNKRNKALLEKAKAAKVKVLVSIGGGSASGDKVLKERYFKLMAADKRADFAKKLAAYVVKHGFDGLDVDIEGPSINEDYGDFIAALAAELQPKGKLLTAALSKGYGGDKVPDAALGHFDLLNIMAYDARGSWDPNAPGQHSSLEMAKEASKYWLGRGVPKEKAILGVPFYGYGFGKEFHDGGFGYSDILAKHPEASEQDQVGETIWHNGRPTIREKAKFVKDEGLGGVMIWSLDNDVKGEKSLLEALHGELVKEKK
ncbi:glycosyl hydrolase family 18 protein [Luteolibacter soli]|uniref:chitinase n=1 Tax=Luteolibacter soli TaxID=3135280 RepID=A0ABU9AQT8_9BACT